METTAVPVAVVTGAAQGIGRKVAEALAEHGPDAAVADEVVAVARSEEARERARRIRARRACPWPL